jgi:hypothetical protein
VAIARAERQQRTEIPLLPVLFWSPTRVWSLAAMHFPYSIRNFSLVMPKSKRWGALALTSSRTMLPHEGAALESGGLAGSAWLFPTSLLDPPTTPGVGKAGRWR